ncbi:phenylacetate--CoA ligase family protein [Brevibacterium pityocampae]|uniref:Coenzyme F390 synthetase n=1 Tax=Brevibacterium pityocampae TaxID=506594 RepID=A0ABP8JLU4_9MICO
MTESRLWLLRDARATHRQGREATAQRQHERFAGMVTYARARSPFYRRLYQHLPEHVTDPMMLPVTSKAQLMSHFDDWVTDWEVTLSAARAFVEDPALVGEKFRGRYTVGTTSGTTGTRGIFLLDERSLAVTTALLARLLSAWLTPADLLRIIARGGRVAMITATGGHYASLAAAAALRRNRLVRSRIGVFGVHTPMAQLVSGLNRFRPAILAPYATMAALLAAEQRAGRLHIDPALVVLSAEGLPAGEYDRISATLGAKVRQGYAATECPFLTYSCQYGWLHVNSDWVLLEPVDADYRPVPPGQASHTTLLSNLANRVQPILRYDLRDVVFVRPDPCPCGDPLPAIRVQGRTADLLAFHTPAGEPVTLPSLAITALLDRVPGVELVQLVHTAPAHLDVRLQSAAGTDAEHVRQAVHAEIRRLLGDHGLGHVIVARGEGPPQPTPGGKFRSVIPLR